MRDKKGGRSLPIISFFSFVLWTVYQTLRMCLGLVIHPYRTVREIMRGVWFVPLVLVPTGVLAWIFVTGRIAAWVIDVPANFRDFIGFFYASFIISLMLWQILLLYLAVRFWLGFKK